MNIDAEQFRCVELKDYYFAYEQLSRAFFEKWKVRTVLSDHEGNDVLNESPYGSSLAGDRKSAITEAVRWGDCYSSASKGLPNVLVFAVPLMFNDRILGGIIAEYDVEADPAVISSLDMTKAMSYLLDMVVNANLTNPYVLRKNKKHADLEACKAKAIRDMDGFSYKALRDIYLVQEPTLVSCIKAGDRAAAVGILNNVLSVIYYLSGDRTELLKSFLLELVVSMSRTAVEAGADGDVIMGSSYSSFTVLAGLDDEADLCEWVVKRLDVCIDAINKNRQFPSSVLLSEAIRYMRSHLSENLPRKQVAAIARLSPAHFSRVIKQTFGLSFTGMMSKFRVERAKELLIYTGLSLSEIANEVGFSDQSYFTKVFFRFTKQTPGHFRRKNIREHEARLGYSAFGSISNVLNSDFE
ncbi:MAG: helix-turn-helix transcriptional regulator [Abditibacteriota bacterium]|nr:helix-turn-helix transcriptional regulator [Abditibacteriota bacterium]